MQRMVQSFYPAFAMHLHPGPCEQQRNLPTMVIQEKNNIINQPQDIWVSISWEFYSSKNSKEKMQCKFNIHSIP